MSEEKGIEMVKVVMAKNGPILVNGPIQLEDANGKTIETDENCALCRCGASKNKPFCDGSHHGIGFEG
jgi:CDGSH-type Zn-finger protein